MFFKYNPLSLVLDFQIIYQYPKSVSTGGKMDMTSPHEKLFLKKVSPPPYFGVVNRGRDAMLKIKRKSKCLLISDF